MPIAAFDAALVAKAVQWLERFYAGVDARLDYGFVELSSETLREPQLAQVWHAALVNERSHAENVGRRRQSLGELLR
jgi:hypothetical protein